MAGPRPAGATAGLRRLAEPGTIAFVVFLSVLVFAPEMRGVFFPFQLFEMLVVVVAALVLHVAHVPAAAGPWWRPCHRRDRAGARLEENPLTVFLIDPLALPLVERLVRTRRVTPDHVTLAGLVVGFASAARQQLPAAPHH